MRKGALSQIEGDVLGVGLDVVSQRPLQFANGTVLSQADQLCSSKTSILGKALRLENQQAGNALATIGRIDADGDFRRIEKRIAGSQRVTDDAVSIGIKRQNNGFAQMITIQHVRDQSGRHLPHGR